MKTRKKKFGVRRGLVNRKKRKKRPTEAGSVSMGILWKSSASPPTAWAIFSSGFSYNDIVVYSNLFSEPTAGLAVGLTLSSGAA